MFARGLVVALVVIGLALPAVAGPERYNPRRAGHPLRIAAYVLHPFGVILDTLIFHPAWWIGQHEPFHTLFGVQTVVEEDVEVASAEPALEPEPGVEPEPYVEPEPGIEPQPEADIEDGHPVEPDQD